MCKVAYDHSVERHSGRSEWRSLEDGDTEVARGKNNGEIAYCFLVDTRPYSLICTLPRCLHVLCWPSASLPGPLVRLTLRGSREKLNPFVQPH